MRKLLAAAVLGAVFAAQPAVGAPARDAIGPGCVSKEEFARIKDGMTKPRVQEIFGTRGARTSFGLAGLSKEYEPCDGDPAWSYVHVDYDWERGAYRVWFKWKYISA